MTAVILDMEEHLMRRAARATAAKVGLCPTFRVLPVIKLPRQQLDMIDRVAAMWPNPDKPDSPKGAA